MEQESKTEYIRLFYRTEIEKHHATLCKLKKYIRHVGTVRLLLIMGMITTLWLCRGNELPVLFVIAAVFMLFFLFFVVYHAKLHARRMYEEDFIRLCENELKALDYDFSAFDGAPEQQRDTQHSFSLDLDLFGENSLFQSVNRTVTQMGKDMLVNRFKQPLDDGNEIITCQEGVREISNMHGFRHKFYVTGVAASKEKKDIACLFSEANSRRKSISGNLLFNVLIWLVPAIWILLITGYMFNLVTLSASGIYFIVSFMLANIPAKHIQKLYISVNKTENSLKTYSELMEQIEKQQFRSVVLQTYRQKFSDEKHAKTSASRAIKRLSRSIGALDQRFSTMGIILNLVYMRDTRQAIRLEQWEKEYSGKMKEWFDALGAFDTFCSFGAFAFNHPDYVYPAISKSYFFMEGKGLGHPLIHRDKCVRNDVHIPASKYFLIITGANMAGKSTYLRTVGVNFLFACTGMPVYAESLTVYPAHPVTSLRTADSLISNESYFFAELKRLKMIIDRLDAGEQLFIILDEILKGTNSVDKQKGSIALIKQLIKKGACGIIATHDLLLGTLAATFPDNVHNRRFEADIQNDELTFSYKIREGIAQNMNATFLMKKMGISGDE
ncbi:MAG: DNA mismatch repair protein MutS [Tannerella sp.]|jgi:DNA mismatch repair ATPase MutS|nr:DNA mismatch repair protein MutS [Tannerella sp.]